MPISSDRQLLYPGGSTNSPEWREIRARIQHRAGDRCEGCGLCNGAIGVRLIDGSFMELGIEYRPGELFHHGWFELLEGSALWAEAEFKVFRIVCTVAHVDRELVDHSDGNLRFWCQQCHNRHDAAARAARAAATRAHAKPPDLLAWLVSQRAPPAE